MTPVFVLRVMKKNMMMVMTMIIMGDIDDYSEDENIFVAAPVGDHDAGDHAEV